MDENLSAFAGQLQFDQMAFFSLADRLPNVTYLSKLKVVLLDTPTIHFLVKS